MFQVMSDSKVISSRVIITLNQGEDNGIDKYLSEFMVNQGDPYFEILFITTLILLLCLSYIENV